MKCETATTLFIRNHQRSSVASYAADHQQHKNAVADAYSQNCPRMQVPSMETHGRSTLVLVMCITRRWWTFYCLLLTDFFNYIILKTPSNSIHLNSCVRFIRFQSWRLPSTAILFYLRCFEFGPERPILKVS